jgi:hypothetical protein
LTGLASRGLSLSAYFEQLDLLPECALNLPFMFKRFIVVYERLPVIHEVLSPKPSSHLLNVLGDAPGSPFLITDIGSSSYDSLYVVTQTDLQETQNREWIGKMSCAKVVLNEHPRFGSLFAASLTSFYNV